MKPELNIRSAVAVRRVLPPEERRSDAAQVERLLAAELQAALPDAVRLAGKPADVAPLTGEVLETRRALLDMVRPDQLLNLVVRPGSQMTGPPYDAEWAMGTGLGRADREGLMGFVAVDEPAGSGFGLWLEAEAEGLLTVRPVDYYDVYLHCRRDAPGLRSRAGAGAIVYDGMQPIFRRKATVWEIESPRAFAPTRWRGMYADIASPPVPGTFRVPLAPVTVPIQPGRPLMLYFYIWHEGVGIGNGTDPFWGALSAELPLIQLEWHRRPPLF